MNAWVQTIVSIIIAVFASSGLWAFLLNRSNKKDARSDMLMGLAHDRILWLGKDYLERSPSYITMDEYDNLKNYLYEPYKRLGGNGTAERVMSEVEKLPIKPNDYGRE